jgi:hypothetical protein
VTYKPENKPETDLIRVLTWIAEELTKLSSAMARLADIFDKKPKKRRPPPPEEPPNGGEQSRREKEDDLPK